MVNPTSQGTADNTPRYCPACNGSGEIRFNASRNRDPQCDDTGPCGRCHGDGSLR